MEIVQKRRHSHLMLMALIFGKPFVCPPCLTLGGGGRVRSARLKCKPSHGRAMRLTLPQLAGLIRCPMIAIGSMIDSPRTRAPTAFGRRSLARAAVALLIRRRMVMLGVVLALALCGEPSPTVRATV